MKTKIFLLILLQFFLSGEIFSQVLGLHFPYRRDDSTGISNATYKARREKILSQLSPNSVLMVFAADVRNRQNDVNYEYRQNSNLWYLSGYPDPGAVLVLSPAGVEIDGKIFHEILFVNKRNPQREAWTGITMGPDEAEKFLGVEKSLDRENFSLMLEKILSGKDTLFTPGFPTGFVKLPVSEKIFAADTEEKKFLKEKFPNLTLKTNFRPLAEMREVKDAEEISLMQAAIDITRQGFLEVMKNTRSGMKEYELEALMEYTFRRLGAEDVGYASIVGSGINGCVLHYTANRRTTTLGDLMLADCGAEFRGYTADITRTFPANGKFSSEQKIIYNIVLEAQDSGIAAAKAGNKFRATHDAAESVISRRLLELGIIQKREDSRFYFSHGTSHYLGLDVHDAGIYGELKENSVITVEPGIYIPEGSPCDEKWWNIGVRIEDDILVTRSGAKNLSGALPRKLEEIERLMKK